jgi:hypothetical protein
MVATGKIVVSWQDTEGLIAYENQQIDAWEKTGKVENLPFLLEVVRELTKREE